ncbi:kelch-like protein 10 [Anguilla rostrata]|uniref:kelch-like protein 10 n=1 Tax=Anguilla rostrata TaxID=7938 RepID=UPI0030CFB607
MDYTILNKLRLEGKLCDVVIEVDGTKFSAHKAVLSASSSYFCWPIVRNCGERGGCRDVLLVFFREHEASHWSCGSSKPLFSCGPLSRSALFTSSSDESEPQEFSVLGLSADTMRLLIEHVYAHYPTVTEATVEPLVQAAVGLGFAGVARVCFGFLEARMCPRNCVGIWGMAASYPQPDLELRAYRFILRHFEEVGRTSREFLGLPLPRVCDIVGDDGLNVKEEGVVFDVILRWIGHCLSERKPYISVLLPKVRMSFLDPNYFLHNVMENSVVKESRECRDLLTRTKRFLQNRLVTRLFSSLISAQPCPPRLPHAILLAVGGWSERSPSSALESYDVRANQWVSVAQDQERPRAYHGAACLGGSVYCVGGRDEEEFFSSVRRFDTATLTWHEAAPMHLRRCYVSVAALGGRVYAMGGFDGHVGHSSAERYQPEANQWSYIQPMHEQRSDASAAALHGKVGPAAILQQESSTSVLKRNKPHANLFLCVRSWMLR